MQNRKENPTFQALIEVSALACGKQDEKVLIAGLSTNRKSVSREVREGARRVTGGKAAFPNTIAETWKFGMNRTQSSATSSRSSLLRELRAKSLFERKRGRENGRGQCRH